MFIEYEESCRDALEEFCDMHSPCEYKHGREHCVNVASTHSLKGHQNAKGKVIAVGRFKSKLQPDRYWPVWKDRIVKAIAEFDNGLQRALSGVSEIASAEEVLLTIHSDRMTQLYDELGSADDFISHTTCLCCLMQVPQYTLPCGHTLCTPCIRSYGVPVRGSSKAKNVLDMEYCPLHPDKEGWPSPYIIRFKPEHAGVRLLSLDG
jgi:hypothetical protein